MARSTHPRKEGYAIARYLLIRRSEASKIGPIPATYATWDSCPIYCKMKVHGGCYAICSRRITGSVRRARRQGRSIWQLLPEIDEIPDGTPFRWGVAGDLPGNGRWIESHALLALARSVSRLKAWAYTHYLTPPSGMSLRSYVGGNPAWSWGRHNLRAIREAQAAGLTVNLSADSPREADPLAELGVAPVATVLPRSATRKGSWRTPAGRRIRVCPASRDEWVTCSSCGFCARGEPERAIVGFPAHGLLWRHVDARVRASA